MAFNVNAFRAQMTGDGARPNLFECSMVFPALASSGGTLNPGGTSDNVSVAQKFTFMCRAAQLPGDTINQIPVNYFGRELKFPGNRTFPEWTVTIINDEDFIIKNAAEKWMSGINSHVGNLRSRRFENSVGYSSNALISHYGKAGDTIKQYAFIGMFPIDISPIEMDWGANDTIEEFAITFAYQYWTSDTTDPQFVV